MLRQLPRLVYGLGTLLLAWLLMQVVHESGHILAGAIAGDRIARVVLHPLAISRTDLEPGRSPLFTTAAGPIVGVALPLALWGAAAARTWSVRHWLRFFAGFCLIANGAYVGMALIDPVGDAEVLLHLGAPRWLLGLCGIAAAAIGLRLWHGLGAEFGWGRTARVITWREAGTVMALLALVIALELAWSLAE